jgi:hypothetical protein
LWYLITTFWRVTAPRRQTAGAPRCDDPGLTRPPEMDTHSEEAARAAMTPRETRNDERAPQHM